MAKIIIKSPSVSKVVVRPYTGGGGGGVRFEVIDGHILNLFGNISVDENGVICL